LICEHGNDDEPRQQADDAPQHEIPEADSGCACDQVDDAEWRKGDDADDDNGEKAAASEAFVQFPQLPAGHAAHGSATQQVAKGIAAGGTQQGTGQCVEKSLSWAEHQGAHNDQYREWERDQAGRHENAQYQQRCRRMAS